MAALQKIRSKAGLLIGVLAVALLAFIFPWSEVSSLINRSKDKAFSVDGEIISTGAYQTRLADFENLQKMMSGQSSLDERTTAQIKEYVYDQMVKEIMLDEQAKKLGLAVTDEQMQELTVGKNISPVLQQLPLFVDPQTGRFSTQALYNFITYVNTDVRSIPAEQADERAQLQNLKQLWAIILNMVKYQCLEEKYNTLLANSILVNNIEIQSASEATKSAADVAYVIDRYTNVADSSIKVTDQEIEKLYNDRKNNFKNYSDLRKISYFTKEILPSQEDFAAVDKEMSEALAKLKASDNPALVVSDYSEIPYRDAYLSKQSLSPDDANFAETATIGDTDSPVRNGNTYRVRKLVDEIVAPDSVKLRMIILPEGENKLVANNRADSIINVIKQGKDFATVANEILPQSNGGEIGWVTEAQLASGGSEFVNAAFKTPIGDMKKLNLQGQIQIVMPEERTQPVKKYKLAVIQMPVVVSDQTLASLDNEINQFVVANSDGKNFVTAAKEKGYNLSQGVFISGSTQNIDNMTGSRQITNWAFNDKVGAVKKFDLNDYRVVAMIDSKIDEGYFPLSDVSEGLKAELIRDKKAELMIADLKSQGLKTLNQYAMAVKSRVDTAKFVTFDTPTISGIGPEFVLSVYAEVGKLNQVDGPIKGENGIVILDVLSRNDQSATFNADAYRQTQSSQNMYRIMSQAMTVLKDKMKVQDNRAKFF